MFHYATALRSNDLAQRRAAIKELRRLGPEAPPSSLDYLVPLLQDPEAAIRDGATEILLNLSKGSADGVLHHLNSMLAADKSTRLRALRIIARVGPGARSTIPALVTALKSDDPVTARMAGEALCAIGTDALHAVESVQTDPHSLMQQEVARVLSKLQGKPMPTPPPCETPKPEEVFRAWLATMEEGMSMLQARRATAERFSLSEMEMRAIEDEGLKCGWDNLPRP
jgi:HEAT repeat protein